MSTRRKDYSLENKRRTASIISAILFFILSYYIIFSYYNDFSNEKNLFISFIITMLVYYFGVFEKIAIWFYPTKQIERNM